MTKVYLCSFATNDLEASVKRFKRQATAFNFYEDIKIFNPDSLSDQKYKQIKQLLRENRKRNNTFGFNCWKPEIIIECLEKIPKNSILQYTDIGCNLNCKGIDRLKEYIKITNKKNILCFQYKKPDFNFTNLNYQILYEYEFTKADCWKYLKIRRNSKIIKSEQIWSGAIFIKNNQYTLNFLQEWARFCQINRLIDDSESKEGNHIDFKDHRHDQSIFSLLCKKENTYALSASECEWAKKNNKIYWEHLENYPILAKRDKKYKLFKRLLKKIF